MLLYLELVEQLREKGTDQVGEIMEQAASLDLMEGTHGRERLVKLREAAIARNAGDEPPVDVARLLGPEFLNVRDQPGLVSEAPQESDPAIGNPDQATAIPPIGGSEGGRSE
jgi:hypothetical protein